MTSEPKKQNVDPSTKALGIIANRRHSIAWQLTIPVPAVLVLFFLLSGYLVPRIIDENIKETVVANAVLTAKQFKTIRSYYTKNVVEKVMANSDIDVSTSHATQDDAIPLPATFIHDVSALLEGEAVSLSLYSNFPFPIRGDRQLDAFQREAWTYLQSNPEAVFARRDTIGGQFISRVAIADRMSVEGCVNCHNSHPDSPKVDWQLGDVRGVLEVKSNIEKQLAAGESLSTTILFAIFFVGAFLIATSLIVAERTSQPIREMTVAMGRFAEGHTHFQIPSRGRKDEIGMMANALDTFRQTVSRERDLQSRVTAIFENNRDGIIVLSEDTLVIDSFNPAAENIFGYARDVVTDTSVTTLLFVPLDGGDATSNSPEDVRTWAKKAATAKRSFEISGRRANGSEFPVEIMVSEFYIDEHRGFILNMRDMEEHKKLEADLFKKWTIELSQLSNPIAELWAGILFLPLIGNLDDQRANDTIKVALNKVAENRSKVFILDISGVGTLDAEVGNYLVKMSKSMRMMGCECIISGLTPTVAEVIIDMGLDLKSISTSASLSDALTTAFQHAEIELAVKS
ncbi:MAG: PAS domain S-box-containing protein [Candidatus Latescibacterota bacterium]|jgi:PAS domain S-box-containing protein